MKITCHSCQSKYNVADEKVQGKTVKIRCKKCGATLVISADGVQANGAPAPTPAPAVDQITFTVNVAEGDQRSMTIEEIVIAYNDGTVTQETYLWADGMTDWLPLAQVESIVAALHSAASAPPPPHDEPPAYEAPPAYEPPPAYAAAPAFDPTPAPAPEERRAARREGARGTRDLFAAQASGDDGLSASAASAFAPPPGNGGGNGAGGGAMTTGARNENSVLFSLAVLTKDEAPAASPMGGLSASPAASARKEDSGLIDLKALSLAAAATSGASPEFAAPLFAPAAPFGSFDSPALPLGGSIAPDAQPKNKMMLIVAAVAVVVALGAIIALVVVMKSGKTDAEAAAASASASASSAPEVAASASAEPPPSATVAASSTPADSASATVAVAKPKPGVKPPPGAAPPPGVGVKPPPAAAATTAAPKPKGGGDCGCAGDLMCLMKCRSGH